jgi:hypothetical protein
MVFGSGRSGCCRMNQALGATQDGGNPFRDKELLNQAPITRQPQLGRSEVSGANNSFTANPR